MSIIRIISYLFVFIFFSSSLYAESMHFDCKCNFYSERIVPNVDNEPRIFTNFCADVHLEIKPESLQMRILAQDEWDYFYDVEETDISFRFELRNDDYLNIERFDKYTSTLTRYTRSFDEMMQTKTYYKQVYRCEKVDKKY